MGKYNREFVSLVCALLCLLCLLGAQARADEAQGEDSGWYFDAGASVYVVDLPDWAPLLQFNYTAGPLLDGPGERVALIDEPVLTPLLQVSVGKELADQWFVEARGEYAYSETSEYDEHQRDSAYEYLGYFSPSGENNLKGTPGWGVSTKTDVTFQEYSLALLAGNTLTRGEIEVRPFAGLWFREMDVDYGLDYRSTGDAMRLDESLETTYGGLLVGIGLDWQLGDWNVEVETTHGLALAHTDYHGHMITGYTDELGLDKDEWAYRGTLQATASIPLDHGWDFGFTCGVRFLSYVPEIMASGESIASGISLEDGRPTHLESATSFSGKLGVNLSYSF